MIKQRLTTDIFPLLTHELAGCTTNTIGTPCPNLGNTCTKIFIRLWHDNDEKKHVMFYFYSNLFLLMMYNTGFIICLYELFVVKDRDSKFSVLVVLLCLGVLSVAVLLYQIEEHTMPLTANKKKTVPCFAQARHFAVTKIDNNSMDDLPINSSSYTVKSVNPIINVANPN